MHRINRDRTIIYDKLIYDHFSVNFPYMLLKIASIVDDQNEFAFNTKHVKSFKKIGNSYWSEITAGLFMHRLKSLFQQNKMNVVSFKESPSWLETLFKSAIDYCFSKANYGGLFVPFRYFVLSSFRLALWRGAKTK